MSNYKKPTKFDQNLIVIGAGSAGLVSAYIAAALNAKVTLIEKHKMGGDCLNFGCVPSKALIRSAKFLSHIKRSKEFGVHTAHAEFNFSDIMERVQNIIKTIEPHDSIERYTELGVNVIQGEAKLLSPWIVEVNDRIISSKNIIIATGARPLIPPIGGLEKINYLTSDNLWELRELPKRLLVLGGGPIGCELSQCFARLGSQVTQVEMQSRLLIREDEEVSAEILKKFTQEGIDVRLNHKALEIKQKDGHNVLHCEHSTGRVEIPFDQILIAVGRKPNTQNFGLEDIDIELNKNGTIKTDDYLRTNHKNIFACGDVAGPYQFTHTASHQAWYCAVNSLFGNLKKFKVDYSVIPWATFTEPEVARVGLNQLEANEKNIPYEISRYDINDLDRAISDSEAHGYIEVLTKPGKDKILGVTIMGEHAGDLIAEYVAAMKHNFGMNKILSTIHIYPTLAEANKFVAGNWKRNHAPQTILKWLETFHKWMR